MTTESIPTESTPRAPSRRGLLLGAAALPAAALALRPTKAEAADLDAAIEARTLAEIRSSSADPAVPGYLVTDPGQEGLYLLDGTDTTSADDTGFIVVSSGGKRYRRIANGAVDVRWFGAAGDGETDDTAAINAAVQAVSQLDTERPVLAFGEAVGYRVTDTITVPRHVDVEMDAPLWYAGPADRAALDIGEHDKAAFRGRYRLDVRRPEEAGRGDWSSEEHVGMVLRNFNTCYIDIVAAIGFTIGVQCYGDSSGFAYNTVHLGHFLDNELGLDLTNRSLGNGIGWAAENLFLGGRFATDGTNRGSSRYGVRIRSTDGTYLKNDNNVFLKPSFELNASVSSPGESLPILIEGGVINRFENCRLERNSVPNVRITGERSMENVITSGYGGVFVDDQSGYRSTEIRGARDRFVRFTGAIFNSGAIAEDGVYYDGDTTIAVPRLAFADAATGGVLPAGKATLTDEWIEIGPDDDAIGVWINTSENKRFVIRRDTAADHGGRVHLLCYDEDGNRLTDPDGTPEAARVSSVFMTRMEWDGSLYGGCYRTIKDRSDLGYTNDVYFSVNPEVTKVRLLLGAGTNPMRLRAFSLYAVDTGSPLVSSGVKNSTTPPAVLRAPTTGQWPRGMYLRNAEPEVRGRFLVEGWRKVTEGPSNTLGTDWIELRTSISP